jgi:hypothetical protein
MNIYRFIILLMLPVGLWAQPTMIKGHIHSSTGRPVQGASVLVRKNDTAAIFAFAISAVDGSFLVRSVPDKTPFVFDVRHVSYETKRVHIDSATLCCMGEMLIVLQEHAKELREVVVKRAQPVIIRSDTTVFNANSYKTPEIIKVEDLLRNMQGFTVDANGRLSFNGKPVERVLIDGDDLADQGYQLITRNLDASLIEKVEVVDNFNTNRLMRNVERTNKVGVNLKIASRYKAKLSGSAELGASVNNRYLADINNIFIGKKVKWLGFGSYNNVARDPSGNVRYYFQQEGGQFSEADDDRPFRNILESGSLNIPGVGDRYVKNNSDLGLAVMNSWRMGKFTKVNMLVGVNDLFLRNQTESLAETEISDQEKWVLRNATTLGQRYRDALVRGSVQTDRGKDHVRSLNFGVQGARETYHFSDLLSGAARDSLIEKLRNSARSIRLGWQETFLFKRQVLGISANYTKGSESQFLDSRSARYLSFWGLDSSYLRNQHRFDQKNQLLDLHLKLNGNKGKLQYEYGAAIVHRHMSYLSQPRVISNLQKPDLNPEPTYDDYRIAQVKGMFKGVMRTGLKGRLSVQGEAGGEKLDSDTSSYRFGIFNGSAAYTHNFSQMRSLRLAYIVVRGFSDYDKLYPSQLLSGNGIIISGLVFEGPVFSQGWTGSYQSNNFYKQRNWSLTFNYRVHAESYAMAVRARPEISEYGFGLTRNNRLVNGLFNWESFVKAVKGKLGVAANFDKSSLSGIVNGVEGNSERSGLSAEAWWTSGFHFPLNLEVRGGVIYTTGRWNGGGINANRQYRWSSKLKFKSENKMYAAFSWNGFLLSNRDQFHGLDLFLSCPLSKRLILHVTGVNLLNSGRVTEKLVMPYNTSQSMFYLVQRYILVSANISI